MSPVPTTPGGLDTYDKLVESVADWLGRDDLNDKIPTFIQLVESDLSRSLNLREQETFIKGTFIADQDYLDMPDDLQLIRHQTSPDSPLQTQSSEDRRGPVPPYGRCPPNQH